MKIAAFSPYGATNQANSVLYLLSNYIQGFFGDGVNEVFQVRCNGAFSVCDRDADRGWKRGILSCANCMREQSGLANWSSLEIQDLSLFIKSEEIVQTRRTMMTLSSSELLDATQQGLNLWELVRGSFLNRFGISHPDLNNKLHEQTLRRFMVAAMRMTVATQRLQNHLAPDLTLVVGGTDVLSASLIAQSKNQNRDCAIMNWDMNRRAVLISHPRSGEIHGCELMVERLTEMRSDPRTWSSDLVKILDEIVDFLDISRTQLSLPMAR